MNTINPGDVCFIRPNITSDDQIFEKKVIRAFNAPNNPCVILRAPYEGTVTVVPISNAYTPFMVCNMNDKNGNATEATYPVITHMVTTVPVEWVGRRIGGCNYAELNEIIEAVQDTIELTTKFTKSEKELPKKVALIKLDHGMITLCDESSTGKELTSVKKDRPYVPRSPIGTPNTVAPSKRYNFPPSIFKTFDLQEYANRFVIDEDLYPSHHNPRCIRDYDVLTEDEMTTIMGTLPAYKKQGVIDLYKTLMPVDAYLFIPKLPSNVLCKLLKIPVAEVAAIKKLCSKLADMTADEYAARTNKDAQPADEPTKNNDEFPRVIMLAPLRPYLNEKEIMNIPRNLQQDFLDVEKYKIKQMYTGKMFDKYYDAAVKKYRGDK